MDTAKQNVARICGADVVIVTGVEGGEGAQAIHALVAGSTFISIVAGCVGGGEGASFGRFASVDGAGIAVVASEQISGDAVPTLAMVAQRADVAIVAGR